MNRGMLPGGLYGPAKAVGSFALEVAQDDHLRAIYFSSDPHLSLFASYYFGVVQLLSEAYIPGTMIVPPRSITRYTHLIQANTTSAAFSFLTMYSIRHRTLTDHPGSFDYLFLWLDDSEKLSHGIGKLTIPSPSPLQLIKHSQGTNSYRIYSQQQNPSSIPSGTNRKTSRMTGRLENVSKRFGSMLIRPILFARRTRSLSFMSLL